MGKKKNSEFTLKIRGCRGSYPVCSPEFTKYGGNTTCYEVRAGDHAIILDAGTGIINLGEELASESRKNKKAVVATVLISHTHHDHTEGFPFFAPLFLGSSSIYMFGPSSSYVEIEDALVQGLAAPYFPVGLSETNSMKKILPVTESHKIQFFKNNRVPVLINKYHDKLDAKTKPEVEISIMKGYNHPKNGVLHYKISYKGKSIVYATDTEGFIGGDTRLIRFAEGADILIHDSQYLPDEYDSGPLPKQGWGHCTYEMACLVAKKAGVKKLILHHHDPKRTDREVDNIEALAKKILPSCEAARENKTFSI